MWPGLPSWLRVSTVPWGFWEHKEGVLLRPVLELEKLTRWPPGCGLQTGVLVAAVDCNSDLLSVGNTELREGKPPTQVM